MHRHVWGIFHLTMKQKAHCETNILTYLEGMFFPQMNNLLLNINYKYTNCVNYTSLPILG